MLGLAGTAPGGWANSEIVETRKRTMKSKEFIMIKGLKENTLCKIRKVAFLFQNL
jgi:hypothetical protein